MKDYEKAEQAIKLLEESGVEFMLAYHDDGNTCKTAIAGKYYELRSCAIGVMARIAQHIASNGYDRYDAIQELHGMALHAVKLAEEAEKKEEE